MKIKVPENRVAQFFLFAAAEAICFFIVCANNRAVALGNYEWTAITDVLFNTQQFALAALFVEDKNARTLAAGAGTVIGGMCGSLVAIWCTKHLYGQ